MSRADINRAYEAWKKSEMSCLEDAYKAPSEAKQWAWVQCIGLRNANNGTNLRIIGRNSQTFSAGFDISRTVSASSCGSRRIRFGRCL